MDCEARVSIYWPKGCRWRGYDVPTWSIASTSVHHFTCGQANCPHDSDGSLSHITNHSTQHIESVRHHSVTARTIRRRLQQSGVSARRLLLGLPLKQSRRRFGRQWCDERRISAAEWNEVVFTDESRICPQHHDGRIRVWRHRGEMMLNSCVMHSHIGTTLGILVWGGIGYHSRTPLVRIAATSPSATSPRCWNQLSFLTFGAFHSHISTG
ncbi:transposable element Tcb1 transposase [Trichonephila clavipes]|nr:transposable element Tcb1 transposase [Trichonephila clavipes]